MEDNDHVDLMDHNASDYVGPIIWGHNYIIWGHARAIELSASPIKRSHADKSFVPKTILLVVCISDTSQGISVEISRSVPIQRWQCVPLHNFGSVQNRSDCVHGNSKMPLLPEKILSHELGTSKYFLFRFRGRKFKGFDWLLTFLWQFVKWGQTTYTKWVHTKFVGSSSERALIFLTIHK